MDDTTTTGPTPGSTDERDVAMLAGLARIGLGVGATLFPRTVLRTWVADDAGTASAGTLGRALGARDLVMGTAVLHAASRNESLPGWLYGTAVADIVDAASSLLLAARRGRTGRRRALVTAGVAGGTAAVQIVLARRLIAAAEGDASAPHEG